MVRIFQRYTGFRFILCLSRKQFRPPRFALLLWLCLFLAACSPGEKVLLVMDRYWPLTDYFAGENGEAFLKDVEKDTKTLISRFSLRDASSPGDLAACLETEKPRAVLLGAFAAMELRGLAEGFPDIRFFVFDAPREGIFSHSLFIRVVFDTAPALTELGAKIREFLEDFPRESPAAAFLDPEMDAFFSSHAAFQGLNLNRIVILPDDSVENVRVRVNDVFSMPPPLYILCAGVHTSLIFDLCRQQGQAAHVVLDDRGYLPDVAGFPVLASLERDYAAAMKKALLSDARSGGVVLAPVGINK
jgi:hypothetical protein